jgi:hypothetical protein
MTRSVCINFYWKCSFYIQAISSTFQNIEINKRAAHNIGGISVMKYQIFLLRCGTDIEGGL